MAARSGVAKTTIYRRWRDKWELALDAVMIDMLPHFADPVDVGDTRKELITFIDSIVKYLGVLPGGPAMQALVSEIATQPELTRVYRERVAEPRREQLAPVIERGIARGDLRSDTDATPLLSDRRKHPWQAPVRISFPPRRAAERSRRDQEREVRPSPDLLAAHRRQAAVEGSRRRNLAVWRARRPAPPVLGLCWRDVDFEQGVLTIRHQLTRGTKLQPAKLVELKTRRSRRDVVLLPELASLLREHRRDAFRRGVAREDDFVFATSRGTAMNFRNVAHRGLTAAANKAGLNREGTAALTLHDLRHSYGSHLVRGGADVVTVSRQMGHARPSITLDVYSQNSRPFNIATASPHA